jgi:hypothetical protein
MLRLKLEKRFRHIQDLDSAPGAEGQKQILLKQVGCEARKNPAVAVVFFLDFSL